jgi:hypothetical protein
MIGRFSKGEPVDHDIFFRCVSHQRRVLETMGLERVAKNITPRLANYLTGEAAE